MDWVPAGWRVRRGPDLSTMHTPLLVPVVCFAFSTGVAFAAAPTVVALDTWGVIGLALTLSGAAGALVARIRRRGGSLLVFATLAALGLGLLRASTTL